VQRLRQTQIKLNQPLGAGQRRWLTEKTLGRGKNYSCE
jgi:hypothetical protein